MPVHVERVVLPGIGVRHDILTADGRRLSVISFRDGGRELALSDQDDPDRADETIALTDDEATALSEVTAPSAIATAPNQKNAGSEVTKKSANWMSASTAVAPTTQRFLLPATSAR